MLRIAQEDTAAFTLLMERHLSGVRGYLKRLCSNPSDADELAQECLLNVWRRAAQFDSNKGAVSTWVYRIAHNCFVDFSRRRPPPAQSIESVSSHLLPGSAAPDSQDESARALAWLNQQLVTLPLNQRSAMTLRYLNGYSTADTAVILNISDTAVDSLTARARRTLQANLEAQESERQDHE